MVKPVSRSQGALAGTSNYAIDYARWWKRRWSKVGRAALKKRLRRDNE